LNTLNRDWDRFARNEYARLAQEEEIREGLFLCVFSLPNLIFILMVLLLEASMDVESVASLSHVSTEVVRSSSRSDDLDGWLGDQSLKPDTSEGWNAEDTNRSNSSNFFRSIYLLVFFFSCWN
jgi:hypothetical protein